MAQSGSSITSLFSELKRFGQQQDYERAIKTANKILHENPDEEKAYHCKVVCHIQLSRFEEALAVIRKNATLSSNLQFEKAYCEYRLNRTSEALRTLQGMTEMETRHKELLAQVLYRLEQFEECLVVYRDLVKNTQDDFDDERETNFSAALASLQLWEHKQIANPGIREDNYELSYNAACVALGQGDYKAAEKKLRRAEELCRASFGDDVDATEEDIDAELGIIRVQLGYTLQMLGRTEEAMRLYNQVVKQKPSDMGLTAVASNNIVSINKDQNVFDSKKKIKVATSDGVNKKLTLQQQRNIAMNQALLLMYTNQGDQCKTMVRSLQTNYTDDPMPCLIRAAQYCREKQVGKAIEMLQEDLKKQPTQMTLKLTLAQLYLGQGSIYQACSMLKSLGDISYKPGVVSALVTLYLSEEDSEAAGEVLNDAINWYRANEPRSTDIDILVRANAVYHLKHGDARVAASLFEELRKIIRELPTADDIIQDLDVDSLESMSTFGARYIKKVIKSDQSPKSSGGTGGAGKKKKKNKKGKLPKSYDPNVDPDPERWLPKRERAGFRGKRKDKRKEIGKGTQGSTPSAPDPEMSKPLSSPSGSEIDSPHPGKTPQASASGASLSQQPGPRQQNPKAAKQKKKKKGGGKW